MKSAKHRQTPPTFGEAKTGEIIWTIGPQLSILSGMLLNINLEAHLARTLTFGPVGIEWLIDETDPVWDPFLAAYESYFHQNTGVMCVEAGIKTRDQTVKRKILPASFIRSREVHGRDFDLGDGLITGTLATPELCRCTIDPILLSGVGLRVLEQFFYLLFHHATLVLGKPDDASVMLLHSSSVLHKGSGLVFCGPPQSGKSTVAGLCPFSPLLGDEATVLIPESDGWRIAGSPINPYCPGKEPGDGPLAGIFLLSQADKHEILPVQVHEAIPFLTAEIIAPISLLEMDTGKGLRRAMDRAVSIYETGLVQQLRFKNDPGFWDLVTR